MNKAPLIHEKELLTGLRDGDTRAFEEIFNHFQPALVFFADRLFGNRDIMAAEEIVQDIFIKLHYRKESFETLQHIKAFLYLATKNACLDKIAKERVRSQRFEKYIATFNESEDTLLRQIIYAEVLREVSQAIELLPEKCRIIMKQFFEEGKDAKEIARDLEITVSTVNNQKARAVTLLKKHLSGAGMALLLTSL